MQTYILLTKLSPDVTRLMKDRAKIGRTWMDLVRESGAYARDLIIKVRKNQADL